MVSLTDPSDAPDVVSTTVGQPLPDIDLRVVDDAGHDVAPGQQSEIIVRSALRMSGYLDDDEATAKTIVDGWLQTGDVGFVDDRVNHWSDISSWSTRRSIVPSATLSWFADISV